MLIFVYTKSHSPPFRGRHNLIIDELGWRQRNFVSILVVVIVVVAAAAAAAAAVCSGFYKQLA